MSALEPYLRRAEIAYLSMEIALRDEMHTFAGGLGVLAGDMARSAADLGMPMVFVSLASKDGYVLQTFDDQGKQISTPNPWVPERWASPLSPTVSVEIGGRPIWIRTWLHEVSGRAGAVPVLLLDTDVDQNEAEDRRITGRLYGGDAVDRLKQEIVLGIGGEHILGALGFKIRTFHLNEGHAALLPLKLLLSTTSQGGAPRCYDENAVRRRCVFTTHTPVATAFDKFGYDVVESLLGDVIDSATLRRLAGDNALNMTRLALSLSGYVNGVAERHAETASGMFPDVPIRSITNGVHPSTWTHRPLAEVFDRRIPHWRHEPEVLSFADQIPDEEVWSAHQEAKRELLALTSQVTGQRLDPDLPLIGFARRMTAYKRPDLLFRNLDRLRRVAQKYPLQIVFAGIAHPSDLPGLELIEELHRCIDALTPTVPIAFVPGYNMTLARHLVAGSDIWLNTPLPPFEASGTSGMKAALNGVLNLSVLDGWWVEGCVEGVTGWAIESQGRSDVDALLIKLEETVLPLFADQRDRWVFMMKQAISKLGPMFNSHRMIRRYASEAYLARP
jgi:starch phosphorylase